MAILSERKPRKTIDINIFRAGKHIDGEGDVMSYGPEDLEQLVESYDVNVHEAPVIVGHEADYDDPDAIPAVGWVKSLCRKGKELWATVMLTPKGNKLVEDGTFKKVSSSFYLPDSDVNPHPGKLAMRHLALVTIPAVKGLTQFSENTKSKDYTYNNPVEIMPKKKSVATGTRKQKTDYAASGSPTININFGGETTPEIEVPEDMNVAENAEENLYEEDGDMEYGDDTMTPDEDEEMPAEGEEEMPAEGEDESEEMLDDDAIQEIVDNYTLDEIKAALDRVKGGDDDTLDEGEDEDTESMDIEGEDAPPAEDEDLPTEDEDEDEDEEFAEGQGDCGGKEVKGVKKMEYEEGAEGSEEYDTLDDENTNDDDGYVNKKKKQLKKGMQYTELTKKIDTLEKELENQKREVRLKELTSYAESVYKQGKLTPAIMPKSEFIKFLSTLNYKGAVNFSEKTRSTQLDFLKKFIKKLPNLVNFGENGEYLKDSVNMRNSNIDLISQPDGFVYEPNALELHKKAKQYSERNKVDYVTALRKVAE